MGDDTTIEALTERVALLEALVERLSAEPGTEVAAPTPTEAPVTAPPDQGGPDKGATPLPRRDLLGKAGVAAVGAVLGGTIAAVGAASPASAATGTFDSSSVSPALTTTNSGTGSSGGSALDATSAGNTAAIRAFNSGAGPALTATGTGPYPAVAFSSSSGIVVVDIEAPAVSTALYAVGKIQGVMGDNNGQGGVGTRGRSTGGAAGVAGDGTGGAVGVLGSSSDGIGVRAIGKRASLHLRRFPLDPAVPAPPTTGLAHEAGEVVFDDAGTFWVCVADGTPGTWVRLAGPSTAGAFTVLLTPVRVYDTRPASTRPGGGTGPVTGTRHGIDLTANSSGLATDATAAMVTLTVLEHPGPVQRLRPDLCRRPQHGALHQRDQLDHRQQRHRHHHDERADRRQGRHRHEPRRQRPHRRPRLLALNPTTTGDTPTDRGDDQGTTRQPSTEVEPAPTFTP